MQSYTVVGVTAEGLNSSCSTSNHTCELLDLACGERYTVNVTASNGLCDGPPSATFDIVTGNYDLSPETGSPVDRLS